MSIFKSIAAGISSVWATIRQHLSDVEADVIEFASPFLHEATALGGKLVTDAALAAVLAAESTGGSGPDKFSAARKTFENTLRDMGKQASQNLVDTLLKAAVEKMRHDHAAAPTEAVASGSNN